MIDWPAEEKLQIVKVLGFDFYFLVWVALTIFTEPYSALYNWPQRMRSFLWEHYQQPSSQRGRRQSVIFAKKKFPVLEAQRLVSRNTSEFILICWTPKVKNWQLTSWKNNMLRKVKYAIYHRIVLTQLQLNFFWYQIFLIPFPGLWSGTKFFRYDSFSV